MCGIAGLVEFGDGSISRWLVERMAEGVCHRGPDGSGVWLRDGAGPAVGLGHRRLAVIDLTTSANQPMHNDRCVSAGRASPLTIVFNGEIYNYDELRQELASRGHHLNSRSDTEVILHLYEEQGAACLGLLRGMFAFAIWDEAKGQLFCARDRVGKKPLYYRYANRRFWFASETRAILSDDRVPEGVRPEAIHAYLALGYVPGEMSAHAALTRLAPGHYLTADARGVEVHQYWTLKYAPKDDLTDSDAIVRLRDLVDESVRIRLISDVPVGAFLSGGIDSALVVATMARQSRHPVKTFSIGFQDDAFNELPLARQVAVRYSTDHHELVVRTPSPDLLPRLAWHYGEPYGDSSAVPTFELARLVRAEITVALNGDGGDESFAGYKRYWASRLADQFQLVPAQARRFLSVAARRYLTAATGRSRRYDVLRFLTSASEPRASRYAAWFGFFGAQRGILTEEFARQVATADPVGHLNSAFARAEGDGLNPLDAVLAVDVQTYLPDDLLVKVDIATMAFGLEARSPLLDHRLMEFAARLPSRMKLRGRRGKHLLRQVAADRIPPDVLNGPKRGFGVPLDRWFRGELGTFARDLLLRPDARVREYVRQDAVQKLLQEHEAGQAAHGQRLWALLMLELWHSSCHAQGGRPAAASEVPIHV